MPKEHPISDVYLDQQTARVYAVLEAAGAWDATPIVMPCAGFDDLTLYFSYTEGEQAADGAFEFKIEISPDSTGAIWHQSTALGVGAIALGVDTESSIQAEDIEYGATGATIERFAYGPLALEASIERIRIFGRESGIVGTPGDLGIEARFGFE